MVWFREDLRLADQPALQAAAASGRPLLCIYVHDEASPGVRPLGGAARWWLHGALRALDEALEERGGRLYVLTGPADEAIDAVVASTKAEAVFWGRRYDEAGRTLDGRIKAALTARGVHVESFNTQVLNEPWTVMNGAGQPFKVFTAYWRAAAKLGPPDAPSPAPKTRAFAVPPPALKKRCVTLKSLGFEPKSPDWAGGMRAVWTRGEAGAQERLATFLDDGLAGYADGRDRPDRDATSRLSPYLRFGEISVREVWHAAAAAVQSGASDANSRDLEKLQSELGWREFSRSLLFHRPDFARENMRPAFDRMPWRDDPAGLAAWRRGQTGYPFVDAGMRQLWTTGWMHNRVRMVVASFLVKHLLTDWRVGEDWFWDTLVDADPGNNPASWQWVAGSGTDAAPYFRVFNPTLQGEKFDPDGDYVRRWVPELARLPAAMIHCPAKASPMELAAAGVRLGTDYPHPIVEHDLARRRALDAFASIRDA